MKTRLRKISSIFLLAILMLQILNSGVFVQPANALGNLDETAPKLIVTEIQPDNKGIDNYEYFEVFNTTTSSVNLTSENITIEYYKIGSSDMTVLTPPDNTIIPAKTAVVFWLSYSDGDVDNTALTDKDFKAFYAVSGSATDDETDNLDSAYTTARVTGANGFPDTGDFGIKLLDSTGAIINDAVCPARTPVEDRPCEYSLASDGKVELLSDAVLPSPGKTSLKQSINTVSNESLSSGVHYTEEDINDFYDTGYREHINRLDINLADPNTTVISSKALDTVNAMETIGDQGLRESVRGNNVVAGINADMYDMTTGEPIGILIKEGKLIISQTPVDNLNTRPSFYIDSSNKPGIDALRTVGTIKVGDSYTSDLNYFNRNQDIMDQIVLDTSELTRNHKLTHTNGGSSSYNCTPASYALIQIDGGFQGLVAGTSYTGTVKAIYNSDGFDIPSDCVALAGYGTRSTEIGALAVDSKANFSFNYCIGDSKTVKNDIENSAEFNTWMVKDGHAILEREASTDYTRTTNARTVLGIKADGALVALTVDKPSTKYSASAGLTLYELSKYLRDIGCVNALNLDGGGSTEMIVHKAGGSSLATVNVPSDGSSRVVTSALLFVSQTPRTGSVSNVTVDKNVSIYKDSGYSFSCRLTDSSGAAVSESGDVTWSAKYGTIDRSGHYTAPDHACNDTITAAIDGVEGTAMVQVVESFSPSSIAFTAGSNIVLDKGATQQFNFTATSSTGQQVIIDPALATWSLTGDIGTVSNSGLVTITAESGNGTLTAVIGGATLTAAIAVGLKEQVIDDFERTGITATDYHVNGYGFGNKTIYYDTSKTPENNMFSISSDIKHSGNDSFRMSYNLDNWTRASNGTLNWRPHWDTNTYTTDGAKAMNASYTTSVYPKKFGIWVYGDGKAPWLRSIFKAGDGSTKTIDLTTDADDVNWTGWKYIEVPIPQGWALPITLSYVYCVETNKTKPDYSGTIYFDDLKFLYTDEATDFSGPTFTDTAPSSTNIYTDKLDFSTTVSDDISGVDPSKLSVTVNNSPQTFTYDQTTGKLSFSLSGLAAGDYDVKVDAFDKAGNESVPPANKTYHVDLSPDTDAPVISDVTPTSAEPVKIPQPRITFKLKDEKSTLTSDDIDLLLDGAELPVYYDGTTGWGYAEPTSNLKDGSHTLEINSKDPSCNAETYSDSFTESAIAQPADGDNFSMSVIPDTQGNIYTERIFNRAEADDTSLVLHLGDIVDDGLQDDYDAAVQYCKIFTKPYFVAAGNHEAFNDTLEQYFKDFGSPTYHFDYGDTEIIFLNSAYSQSISASDSTQFHWLEETLKNNTKKNVVVIDHVITRDDFGTAHEMSPSDAAKFESILSSYKSYNPNVTVDVIFGHLHTLENWQKDGVNYIIGGNAANKNYVTYDQGSFLGSGKLTIKDDVMTYSYDPFLTNVYIKNDAIAKGKLSIAATAKIQMELYGDFNESPSGYVIQLNNHDLVGIRWTSSDDSIATVDSKGIITALKVGTATISAESGGKSNSVEVNVVDADSITPVKIELSLGNGANVGQTILPTIKATDAYGTVYALNVNDVKLSLVNGCFTQQSDGSLLAVKTGDETVTVSYKGLAAKANISVNTAIYTGTGIINQTGYISDDSIKRNKDNFTVDLTAGKTKLSGEQMKTLIQNNSDKPIVLSGTDYSITFAAGTMRAVENQKDCDFSLKLNSGENYGDIQKLAQGSLVAGIDFSYSGQLPGEALVRLKVGSQYAGKTLYYYYYNELTGAPELMQSTVIGDDCYATIKQSHCSTYLLTDKKLNGMPSIEKLSVTPDAEAGENTTVPYFTVNGTQYIAGFSAMESGTLSYLGNSTEKYQYKNNSKQFSDTSGHWAKNAIDFVTARELFSGIDSSVFSPDQTMTRGMIVTVLGRLAQIDTSVYASSTFTDVNADSYYAPYIEWAYRNGIVSGIGNSTFAPDKAVTREELAVLLTKFSDFASLSLKDSSSSNISFLDSSSISSWATTEVGRMKDAGIISGRDGNTFVPNDVASRAEVATMLMRFIKNAVG